MTKNDTSLSYEIENFLEDYVFKLRVILIVLFYCDQTMTWSVYVRYRVARIKTLSYREVGQKCPWDRMWVTAVRLRGTSGGICLFPGRRNRCRWKRGWMFAERTELFNRSRQTFSVELAVYEIDRPENMISFRLIEYFSLIFSNVRCFGENIITESLIVSTGALQSAACGQPFTCLPFVRKSLGVDVVYPRLCGSMGIRRDRHHRNPFH